MICINKNLNSYKILSNVFSEAEIAQLYIDNKYALPTDEESYQLVKAFSDKPTQIKEGVEELFESNLELANAVYEVLGFNQLITPNDRIVFGHPTIGKSFLKNQGEDKFISLDDDYATEINDKVKEIANKYNVTTYQVKDGGTQKWNNEYNQMMQEMFNVAKQRAISENKTLFTSNTNLLRNNAESFDKVINLTDKEFERRIQERGAKYDTKEWKSQINKAISKLPANKVINTDKYLSDLFITPQQKQQALQLYSQYLDTIFPDSKLKDIVYHGTTAVFEKFDKSFYQSGVQDYIYFGQKGKPGLKTGNRLIAAILNIKNPDYFIDTLEGKYSTNSDGFIEDYSESFFNSLSENQQLMGEFLTQYGVKEPEQIHILGSKQDIAGFKDFVSKESSVEDMLATPALDYNFKALDIINKNINKISSWEKNKSINEDTLYKKIGELGVPKEQLELIRQSKGDNIAEKLSSFIAEYSYTVEINTAKDGIKDAFGNVWVDEYPNKKIGDYITIDNKQWKITGTRFEDDSWGSSGLEQRESFIVGSEGENTNYYNNLTVPGGTNYTEQEIATPAITPNIKGHAQFATDKGIGWFRSDEQVTEGKVYQEEEDDYGPAILQTYDGKPTKTRRILEVQSDWGQKQRKSSDPDINVKYDIQQIINDLQKSGDLKIDCN